MAERSIAPVLKTGDGLAPSVGSNPTPSARTSDELPARNVDRLAVGQRCRRAGQYFFLAGPVLRGPENTRLLLLEHLGDCPVRPARLDREPDRLAVTVEEAHRLIGLFHDGIGRECPAFRHLRGYADVGVHSGAQLLLRVRQVDLDAQRARRRFERLGRPRHLAGEFRTQEGRDTDYGL